MSTPAEPHRPFRVAIVGSGPSAFYAAEALFAAVPKVKIDIFERLPAPFGLVRYGVAPDHAKIKNVTKIYEKTLSNPAVSYFGNVAVGKDISVEELRTFYDAIIFACGTETDKTLGIPGENLQGSYTAREFVAWYNGHPDYRDRHFDFSHPVAVVIGQGNVAMDVCRILCKTVDELKETDIAQHALDALAASRIKEIHCIGRRGPVQAAFTTPEIREFSELADCDAVMAAPYLKLNPESQAELDDPNSAPRVKTFEILRSFTLERPLTKRRKFVLHFYKSPKELVGHGRLEKLVLERTKLSGPVGAQQALGTGELLEVDCGLLFRSVGYRGVPIPGIPFDENKGTFLNAAGRIGTKDAPLPGLYAVGWIKRGPIGVIGTNKPDSVATVNQLLADLPTLKPCPTPDTAAVKDMLTKRRVKFVDFSRWKRIDMAEIDRGRSLGKPREKFARVDEMLAVLRDH